MRTFLTTFLFVIVCGTFVSAAPVADDVDQAIARGLNYLLEAQLPDGSFPGMYKKTTALSSLAAMACLATGHVPGDAKYGVLIDRSLDFVLEHQMEDGYFGGEDGKMYAHAITTLFLTEISGMVSRERQAQIDAALPRAIKIILDAQKVPKNKWCSPEGGWRYTPTSADSDTSCSGWCLMALRSARLNGAQVPGSAIKAAVDYMHRHHDPTTGSFGYQKLNESSVTLSGAGILCLELCGRHEDPVSLRAAKYLMSIYNDPEKGMLKQSYRFYGMYYASQGLFQIGGEYWKEFSEWMYRVWVPMQRRDGSWIGSPGGEGSPIYATSMIILAFAVPYRQLPVYQRDETVDE